jgi:hypothetical protein
VADGFYWRRGEGENRRNGDEEIWRCFHVLGRRGGISLQL